MENDLLECRLYDMCDGLVQDIAIRDVYGLFRDCDDDLKERLCYCSICQAPSVDEGRIAG